MRVNEAGRQSSAAATRRLGQFSKWLRRVPIEKDLMLNLLFAELRISSPFRFISSRSLFLAPIFSTT